MDTTFNRFAHREQRSPHGQTDQAFAQEQVTAGSDEINRLICAAIVNDTFREDLLERPSKALKEGYSGEKFSLSLKERSTILAIDAATLDEFVVTLMDQLNLQTETSSNPVEENKHQFSAPYTLLHSSISHGAD